MIAKKNYSLLNDADDVDVDLLPFLVRYKDGHIERFLSSPFVAASEDPSTNRGVATRDVVIDPGTGVSARLFLPSRAAAAAMATRRRRLPLVVYIHGGSFCTESAFGRTYHRYATSLVDPWLAVYADPGRTFVAGDSAGGNIAYHTAVRASTSTMDDGNGIDFEGLIMVHPYFWGLERLPSEAVWDGAAMFPADRVDRLWPFVTAGQAGNDDARINPPDEEIASLACRRVLMAVAEKDTLRDRGVLLSARISDGARAGGGEVTLVESEGEDHGFHLYSPLRGTSRKLMDSIVNFINQPLILGVPIRPFKDPFGYGMEMKRHCTMPSSKANYGLFACPAMTRPNNKTYKQRLWPPAALLPGTHVTKNFF
ncbi:hypothetical protein U9M48_011545 [Paspalum notatum var. saurae]|uniref:Alpha/beta hydrolase fold-3 domain-containing protein n=1 Tax=Paspalum notatum var. saurae TaxID=547442 RepID=A0AAQ3WH89_PASNO